MNDENKYKSNLPYPEVKVLGPNQCYALLLKEDYVGLVSEMTAINQYLYHHFEISFFNEEIAKALEEIAIVEMKHLEILAKLIILLGEKPIYYSQNSFWNGSYVFYGDNMLMQLQSDLDSELKAIEIYNKHIGMIGDPFIKKILERIVIDEKIHVNLFIDMINSLNCK